MFAALVGAVGRVAARVAIVLRVSIVRSIILRRFLSIASAGVVVWGGGVLVC